MKFLCTASESWLKVHINLHKNEQIIKKSFRSDRQVLTQTGK
jgi:hypothetical protein